LFQEWQRTQTQSSVMAFGPETANGCPVLQRAEPPPRGTRCGLKVLRLLVLRAPHRRASGELFFLLTNDLHGRRPLVPAGCPGRLACPVFVSEA
jgi:hypothetical protein